MSSATRGLKLTVQISNLYCPMHSATCGDLLSETGVAKASLTGLDHSILTGILGTYLGLCSTRTLMLVQSRGIYTIRSNSDISCSVLPVSRLLQALGTGLSMEFTKGHFRRNFYSRSVINTS